MTFESRDSCDQKKASSKQILHFFLMKKTINHKQFFSSFIMETFFQQKLICGKNLNLKPLKHVELILVGFD